MRCPCCDRILYQAPVLLSPLRRAIFEFVRDHPRCTAQELFKHLYSGTKNGGPLTGINQIHLTIRRMKKDLRPHGLIIKSERIKKFSCYFLTEIEDNRKGTRPGKGRSEEETLANANLISVAREMLDVLKVIVQEAAFFGWSRSVFDTARDVIAKATGEQD